MVGGQPRVGDAELVEVGDGGGHGDDQAGDARRTGGVVADEVAHRAGADEGDHELVAAIVERPLGDELDDAGVLGPAEHRGLVAEPAGLGSCGRLLDHHIPPVGRGGEALRDRHGADHTVKD